MGGGSHGATEKEPHTAQERRGTTQGSKASRADSGQIREAPASR